MMIRASEVIRCTRGKRPSALISEKLGYKTNTVYRWETGKASPTWKQFIEFCEVADRKILSDFEIFFGTNFPLSNGAEAIKHFAGMTPYSEVAKRLGVTKSTVSKWLHGRQEPPCQSVFELVSIAGSHLHAFFGRYPRFREIEAVANHLDAQNLFCESPGVLTLFNLLDLETYRSSERDEAWIAAQCGLSLERTHELISEMVRLNILKREGKKLRNVMGSVMLLTAVDYHRHCMSYWLDLAKAKMQVQASERFESRYRVFSADEKAIAEIKQVTAEYIRHVDNIIEIAQSRPQTKVLNLVLALNSALSARDSG